MRQVIISSILLGFVQKNRFFFEGCSCFKFNNLGLTLGTNLKFFTSVAKELKIKVNIFWANSYFCRSYKEKPNSGGLFHPILNRVKYDLLLLRFS